MPLGIVAPPASNRGRKSRFDGDVLKAMAAVVKKGEFYGDTDPVDTKATAQGRAAAARAALAELTPSVDSSTRVWPVDPDDEQSSFMWAVGPAIERSAANEA